MAKQHPVRVCFVFASPGIGGAERSMARMIAASHPEQMDCTLVLAGAENKPLVDLLRPIGVPCHSVGKYSVGSLARLFEQCRPDVVYLFGQIRTLWWARAARLARVPIIVGAERGSGTRLINRIGRSIDKHFLNAYITNSGSTARVLIERIGIPAERVRTIYNGIALDHRPPGQVSEMLELGSPTIACVANIRPLKGQIVLLRAVDQLRTEFPHLRAVLVGEDLTDGRFAEQVASEGLADTYSWAGFMSDVRPVLERADLFVLPSLYREGMPTSIIEAMSASLPVIGTDVGGVGELIRDKETGFLVPPDRVEALADAIGKLLRSSELRERFGASGRKRVESEFTIHSMVENHLRAFREIRERVQQS